MINIYCCVLYIYVLVGNKSERCSQVSASMVSWRMQMQNVNVEDRESLTFNFNQIL